MQSDQHTAVVFTLPVPAEPITSWQYFIFSHLSYYRAIFVAQMFDRTLLLCRNYILGATRQHRAQQKR